MPIEDILKIIVLSTIAITASVGIYYGGKAVHTQIEKVSIDLANSEHSRELTKLQLRENDVLYHLPIFKNDPKIFEQDTWTNFIKHKVDDYGPLLVNCIVPILIVGVLAGGAYCCYRIIYYNPLIDETLSSEENVKILLNEYNIENIGLIRTLLKIAPSKNHVEIVLSKYDIVNPELVVLLMEMLGYYQN